MNVLRSDLIERARKMTHVRSNNHPWLSMDDVELLRSAGLILLDHESRREVGAKSVTTAYMGRQAIELGFKYLLLRKDVSDKELRTQIDHIGVRHH